MNLCEPCEQSRHEACIAYREENTVASLAQVLGLGPSVCDCECDASFEAPERAS